MLELSFQGVCDLFRKTEPDLIEHVDKLWAVACVTAGVVAPPELATAALATLSSKNELVKAGRSLLAWATQPQEETFVDRARRMEVAYGLIRYVAFFEELDLAIPENLRDMLALCDREKRFLVSGVEQRDASTDAKLTKAGGLPHPILSLEEQRAELSALYAKLADRAAEFFERVIETHGLTALGYHVGQEIREVPTRAIRMFDILYYELACKFEDFALWASFHERKRTEILIGNAVALVRQYGALIEGVDERLQQFTVTIRELPELAARQRRSEIADRLARRYAGAAQRPVIEDAPVDAADDSRLVFPTVEQFFIPQNYRILRYTNRNLRLEDDDMWTKVPARNDLLAYMVAHWRSPYAIETPLVILGEPGGGKSMLTLMLATRLAAQGARVVRVPLRDVDSGGSTTEQIQEHIADATDLTNETWAALTRDSAHSPVTVILDGYDELLQASGQVFRNYLLDIQHFQRRQVDLGCPVRVIVTSRVALIDKASVPNGTTVLRLLEFDAAKQEAWIKVWNSANRLYFARHAIKPFSLSTGSPQGHAGLHSLSGQPILLLMLAIYDSDHNALARANYLAPTLLYDSLIRRFVTREQYKFPGFSGQTEAVQQVAIDEDVRRLGVAAVGMYSRRKLHILSTELAHDLTLFQCSRRIRTPDDRTLDAADSLLGSFFFVHRSSSQMRGASGDRLNQGAAFEFLHNTFGEFLTADFILTEICREIETLRTYARLPALVGELAPRLRQPGGANPSFVSCLMYTPLFSRPVVMEMLREWFPTVMHRAGVPVAELSEMLIRLFQTQIQLIEEAVIPPAVTVRSSQLSSQSAWELASVFTSNIAILCGIFSGGAFRFFAGADVPTAETRWQRLTWLWRGGFTLDQQVELARYCRATRDGAGFVLNCRRLEPRVTSGGLLEKLFTANAALGDTLSASIAGLALQARDGGNELLESLEGLNDQRPVNSELALLFRLHHLAALEPHVMAGNIGNFMAYARDTLRVNKGAQGPAVLDVIASCKRAIASLGQVTKNGRIIWPLQLLSEGNELVGALTGWSPSSRAGISEIAGLIGIDHLKGFVGPNAAYGCEADAPPAPTNDDRSEEAWPSARELSHSGSRAIASYRIARLPLRRSASLSPENVEKIATKIFQPSELLILAGLWPDVAVVFVHTAILAGFSPPERAIVHEVMCVYMPPPTAIILARRNPTAIETTIRIAKEIQATAWVQNLAALLSDELRILQGSDVGNLHRDKAAFLALACAAGAQLPANAFEHYRHLTQKVLAETLLEKPAWFWAIARVARTHGSRDLGRRLYATIDDALEGRFGSCLSVRFAPAETLPELRWIQGFGSSAQLANLLEGS